MILTEKKKQKKKQMNKKMYSIAIKSIKNTVQILIE